MTNNETGIDQSNFLAKVAARKEEKAATQYEGLNSLVGNTVGSTPSKAKVNGHANNSLRVSPESATGLEDMLRRDAEDMYEEFHTERSGLDKVIDDALAQVDVLGAYRKWIRKMNPKAYDGQTESIMISCPTPGHEDARPSAWANTVKGDGGVWYCGGCGAKGDKYDLAAIGLGFNQQTYKTDGTFRDLKMAMCRDLGVNLDDHILGPAARAYKAKQAAEAAQPTIPSQMPAPQAEPVAQPTPPPTPPKAQPAAPKRKLSNEEVMAAIHADAQTDYKNRMHRYYDKPADEQEPQAASVPTIPMPSSLGASITPPVAKEETVVKAVSGLAGGMPAPVVGNKGAMPSLSGLSLGLGGAPVAPPADPGTPAAPTPPPGWSVPKAAPTPAPLGLGLGLGIAMPLPGGKLFVPGGQPLVDPNDIGLVKAMLEDEGIQVDSDEPELETFRFGEIKYNEIVGEDTFLGRYCQILVPSMAPNEWNFWNGILALGLAVGRRRAMEDMIPVLSNMYVCLFGETTVGKSQAKKYLFDVVRKTLPWVGGDPGNTGARIIKGAASGEMLVTKFRNELTDPAAPSKVIGHVPVTGLVEYDEFQTIMSSASSQRSNFIPILQGLYDGYDSVESHSFSTGSKVAEETFATLLTTTQPSAIKRLVGDEHADNGFLNRMLFVTGKPKPRLAFAGAPLDISPAAPYLMGVHEWAKLHQGEYIKWSPSSHELARQFIQEQVIADMETFKDNKLIQRMDLLMKKLIMLFSINLRANQVPMEAVESAIKLYSYLFDSYSILDEAMSTTMSADLRKKIMAQILRLTTRNNKPPTRNEIHDALGRNKVDGEILIRAIKTLCELGDIREIQWPLPGMGQVGRKSVRFGLARSE